MKPAPSCHRRRARLSARILTALLSATALAGCMVGPDYHRPIALAPVRLKEVPPPPGWAYADPHYAELPKGHWWTIYNDPVLNRLEEQVNISNQTIKEDEANFRQARALVDEARASLFPTATATPGITRTGAGSSATSGSSSVTSYSLAGSASWEIDVWGAIRRQVESQVAAAQASQATLDAARLSEQTTLATDYFELRYQDSLITLLSQYVVYYQQSETILRNSVNAGVTSPEDLLQAETETATTQAEVVQAGVLRSEYEHAIAMLTGHAPSQLSIAPGALTTAIPPIPVTVPSLLLQRRPDIAEAERQMEEENALIGVAVAAFYPTISLSGALEYAGNPLGSLIETANRTWSLAASAAETLFDGGERTAAVRAARAAFDAAIANYRQTVLAAFQTLEDQLSSLRILSQQAVAERHALDLANQAVTVALNQYHAGTIIYTTVITDQQTALTSAETLLGVQESQMVASVTLVGQLGGGWDTRDLISKARLQVDNPLLPSFIQKDQN